MPAVASPRLTNRLLQRVTPAERERVMGSCESVDLVAGDVVSEAGRPFRYVHFPLNALITAVSKSGEHPPLELAMIGNEGMLGSTLALGINRAAHDAHVRGPGTSLRMTAACFSEGLSGWPGLQRAINRYMHVVMGQLAQSSVCTRFHELNARLARCLLMTHDRAQSDTFYLTHKSLADLLGMRRSGVTIAAGHLQDKGYIRYSRGHITILDRVGLEAQACECYRNANCDYDGLFT
jgi:CRP-like cAMP-binding protein